MQNGRLDPIAIAQPVRDLVTDREDVPGPGWRESDRVEAMNERALLSRRGAPFEGALEHVIEDPHGVHEIAHVIRVPDEVGRCLGRDHGIECGHIGVVAPEVRFLDGGERRFVARDGYKLRVHSARAERCVQPIVEALRSTDCAIAVVQREDCKLHGYRTAWRADNESGPLCSRPRCSLTELP